MTCSIDGCAGTYKAKGYCNMHYRRLLKTGTPGEAESRPTGPKAKKGDLKTCGQCGIAKSLDEFHRAKSGSHGRHWMCKPCRSAHRKVSEREANIRLNAERRKRYAEDAAYREQIKRTNRLVRYGLTADEFDALLASQGGRCAVCQTDNPGKTDWHVDHDHACCPNRTGRTCGRCTRALLCSQCNLGLGHFRDDADRLMAAAAYLLQFQNILSRGDRI